ncbi:MAG: hydrolase 1, exosortase A system-associated [Methylococcales bacterium]
MRQLTEIPLIFSCEANSLCAMAHIPQPSKQCGVLIVVGGPQYRVGSHRQFLLLARELASNGFPVLRFDYTGMGDSEGEQKTFENIDADLRAAIDVFYQQHSDLKNIVIWGLCDAASAALFYAYQDQRVKGLVLLNPWVYTTQGAAKTYLKHYYLQRLLSRELWSKIFSGKFDAVASIASLVSMIKKMLSISPSKNFDKEHTNAIQAISPDLPLPERMKQGLERFEYPVLCILSGHDLTASEFKELIAANSDWQQLFNQQRIQRLNFDESDHTFSRAVWRNQVSEWTIDWLQKLEQ